MSGVLLNIITVLVGSAVGLIFGRLIKERFKTIVFSAIGMSTFVIGLSMAIGGLGDMGKTGMKQYAGLVFIGSLVVGSLIGEALRIEYWLERLGGWLQDLSARFSFVAPLSKGRKDEPGEKGHTLVEGFVTASLLFCVGAMTVLGSLQDGMGDHQLLYIKSTLDGLASVFLASTLGIGVAFSAVPVAIIQGGLALAAHALTPYMTPGVVTSITAVGGALIVAIGIDLLGIKRLPIGNMLPAVIIAAFVGGMLG